MKIDEVEPGARPLPPAGHDARTVNARALLTLAPIEAASLAAVAYERIRALIASGGLPTGARLLQHELAVQLGISRTPVREALRRLAGEGLLEAAPQRSYRVLDLGITSVSRRLQLRLVIEPAIAELAANMATASDLIGMRDSIDAEAAAADTDALHDASRDFHLHVARATHNEELVDLVSSKWIVEVGRRLTRESAEVDWQGRDLEEHAAITEAIEQRDGPRAATLMRTHLANVMDVCGLGA